MKIRKIISQLESSPFFKLVRFAKDIPDLSKLRPEELPAIYMLPASTRGGPEGGDLHLSQENVEVYSFCVVTQPPTHDGNDEPLDDALKELRSLLFGLEISQTHSPLALGEGDLFDFSTNGVAWIETYVTRRTYRS